MKPKTNRRQPGGLLAILVGVMIPVAAPATANDQALADPAHMLDVGERKDFNGANSFSVESTLHGRCLRSVPRRSASTIYQRVDMDGRDPVLLQWSWRVDQLQSLADIRTLETEDVGAMIMLLFGEPSLFNRNVPTLAYVWTATPVDNGAMLPSKRFDFPAYIQMRGRKEVGRWENEARNVTADFQSIFGHAPSRLRHIAIFNDNDQTGEATSALFCPVTRTP